MLLTDLLTNIANAIRQKDGTTDPVQVSTFPDRILAIPTGITPEGTLEITENGTYDVTNYASITVNITSQTPTE